MTKTTTITTISEALRRAGETLQQSSDSPRLDAEVLLGTVTGMSRASLYANPERPLSAKEVHAFDALLAKRRAGKPVAHLTGEREFWSLAFVVNEHTLVPRPETELLVETALRFMPEGSRLRVLDLGTGSGAIAIAIAVERVDCEIMATDVSPEALAVAMRNAERLCPARINFLAGNWFGALPDDTHLFDIILSNPPYIAATETALTDRELEHEPPTALYSGQDGMDDLTHIIQAAPRWLRPGGRLLLEHGYTQHESITKLLSNSGLESVEYATDLAGNPRVTHAKKTQRGQPENDNP